jgi:septum site-determining protein MinC
MEATAESEAAGRGARAARAAAFELKGVMTSLAVMRLSTEDLEQIDQQLRVKVAQLPQFFQDAPVVLDLGAVPDGGATLPLGGLVRLLRAYQLIPVGVTNCGDIARAVAVGLGLGVMPYRSTTAGQTGRPAVAAAQPVARPTAQEPPGETTPPPEVQAAPAPARKLVSAVPANHYAAAGRSRIAAAAAAAVRKARGLPPLAAPAAAPVATPTPSLAPAQAASQLAATSAPTPGVAGSPMIVRNPVRAGQVIYARNSDLLVLAPVNPGAEVIADGNVHIYSTLRGRAVAGAQGDVNARVFCQRLHAELVAVAGAYIMAEDIPRASRGQAVQVHMDGGECRISPL